MNGPSQWRFILIGAITMISGKARLGALICLLATLTACGGGGQEPNAASTASTASTESTRNSWGIYTEGESTSASSDIYPILRTWRTTSGAATAHLAIDPTTRKLVLLSPDLQTIVVRFSDGPTVDAQTSAAWLAPTQADAGIVQIGVNLHRFEWDGIKATLSPAIYTLQTQGDRNYSSYVLNADDKGFVLLDHTNLVMIAPNGTLTRTTDLLTVNGVDANAYLTGFSMNAREVLIPISHGLLSIDRETGQTHWVDQFDGSHSVNRILWAANESTGYVVHIPDAEHWHEQVIQVSSTGVKQVVADHILAPPRIEGGSASNGHKEIGYLSINLSGSSIPDVARASTYRPPAYAVWCDLPATATEDQWTCKGNHVFAYDVDSHGLTLLGALNTQVEHSTPSSMRTASDVVVDGQHLFVMGTPANTDSANPPQMQEEIWQFSPDTPGSLHWVETHTLP